MAPKTMPCHPENERIRTHSEFLCPILPREDQGLAAKVRQILEELVGARNVDPIIRHACPDGSLATYLARPFFDRHFQDYHRRPVYWLVKRKDSLYALCYENLTTENLKELLAPSRQPKEFRFDHGIAANMKPFRRCFAIPLWRRWVH